MPTVRRNSCEKIMGFGENVAKMQRGTIDRISELPEFILHIILSMLDTKEVCRASVLSKRWYIAWSSIPVLDFQPRYFNVDVFSKTEDDNLQRFVEFIDKTMQRYSMQKYRITKMYLELPKIDEKLESLIDKWILIAVQNQIENFEIRVLNYRLPEILFSAKSLKVLICQCTKLPYYATMELVSLEYLTIYLVTVDGDMLQRIISSSPLVELDVTAQKCLVNISLPWMKKGNGTMQSNLQESPLQKFVYGSFDDMLWPWNINVVALKNLRKLEFSCVPITDDIVYELACGLVALESLVLESCLMLKCIKISSISLKEFRIGDVKEVMNHQFPNEHGLDLMKVTIDAPNLLNFSYNWKVETSLSLIRVPDHCTAHFFPLVVDAITTVWFVKLKKFLTETNFFKSLVMDMRHSYQIVVEEDQLNNVVTDPPYKLRELKLRETRAWNSTESSLKAFLDGLFWFCRPDVLSITTVLKNAVWVKESSDNNSEMRFEEDSFIFITCSFRGFF
ncbi:putative F-box/LRR-repeat protein At4g15060 isoform X2 [Silene latifolia]|uniref:putative F-box/LRR-repeat protein At4g15060 isoform X2 n=1 Tax=Silene latifolia TaxID=37657 RepID=UPI003D77851A